MLQTLVALLAAAALAVPLSRRAGFGSVLGYLVAGIAIGPSGLRLVTDLAAISRVSELGVVMLLFLIGLEVRPQRLWVMRRAVFGLGSAQVVATGAALGSLAHAAGLAWPAAAVLGVDACPMEGLVPAEYDRVLKLDGSGYLTVVACALGYRAAGDKYAALAKVRYPTADLVRVV